MKIPFTKMSGAGNDFVVVDNLTGIITNPESFSIRVCDRRFGIGADGVLLVASYDQAAFSMKYYNADGSNAGMCGNGGRCIAKYAYDHGIVTTRDFSFEGFGYIYNASRIDSTTYELKMKNPVNLELNQVILVNDQKITGNYLNTGTDHSVVFLADNPGLSMLETVDVHGIGKTIRYHEVYKPKGVNVNFVQKEGPNSIKIRTYERGVENETLACGTGSVASALLSSIKFNLKSPVGVTVRSGEILWVGFERSGNSFFDVTLKGSAIVTFTGEIEIP